MMVMTLFLKECKVILKSIVYIAFICAIILFYSSQLGFDNIKNDIEQYYSGEYSINNPLMKPQEGLESYGTKYSEIPELIMYDTINSLITDWKVNTYITYPFMMVGREVKLSDKNQADIAQILTEITGLDADELYNDIIEIKMQYIDDDDIPHWEDIDYSEIIPIIVTYDEFKLKMKQVSDIIGNGSDYSENSLNKFYNSQVPITYEDKLEEYNEFLSYDKITGAYAREFCDYMGIIAGLLSVFVPAAFLLRDKRAKINELIYSRDVSSAKIILIRYTALVFMMVIPFLLLSLAPLIPLIGFASDNNLTIDVFGFAKYIIAWILPTLMTTTAVAYILVTLTETPIAIGVQFIWCFLNIIIGAFGAVWSGTGELIDYGSLIIRHNSIGNLQIYKDNLNQLITNRVFYAILSVVLIILTFIIYEQKRRGKFNVRKIFRNRKKAN